MLYFTADMHLGSDWKVASLGRPFTCAEEHDEVLLNNINETCSESDTLLVVGDYINYSKRYKSGYKKVFSDVSRIKCDVKLILGNNEKRLIKHEFRNKYKPLEDLALSSGFKSVSTSAYVTLRGKKFYVVHEPVDIDRSVFNLFGHLHKDALITPYGINVGTDLWGFRPINEEQIFELIKRMKRKVLMDENYKTILKGGRTRQLWQEN